MRAWWGLMVAVLCGVATPAEAAWREASSRHFLIYSEQSPAVLQAYAEKLERFDALLRQMQGDGAEDIRPTDRLTLYALRSPGDVEKVMGFSGAAGVYQPGFMGSIALTSLEDTGLWGLNAQVVLLHEYTHHFTLHYHPGSYPGWFTEGYAEFLSTTQFEADGSIGVGLPANHRAYALSAGNGSLPMKTLLAEARGELGPESEIRVARGWLLIHYLTFEPKRAGQLAAFLGALGKGEKPLVAGQRVFGNLADLDHELNRYLSRHRLPYFKLTALKLEIGKVTVRELSPGENAVLRLRIDTRYGVGAKKAQHIVQRARQAAAPYPADPIAQCELAEAEDDAGHPDESDAAADRILAVQPKDLCGLIFKGRAMQLRAQQAKAPPEDKRWAAARAWFIKANAADLDQAWPLALYYLNYRIAGAKPTANAIEALLAAQNREPGEPTLRSLATIELLRRGKADAARAMLGPLVMAPHGTAGAALLALYERIGHEDPVALADEMTAGKPAPRPGKKD